MKKTVIVTGIVAAFAIFAIGGGNAKAEETNTSNQDKEQTIVEVQKGDSLSKLAKKHETTYQRIFFANTFIQDPDVIHPGEKVRIPDADEELKERPVPSNAPAVSQSAKKQSSKPVSSNKKSYSRPTSNSTKTVSGGVWDRLAQCESGGNWSINTGNGYYGGVQFSAATWRSVGGSGLPHQNSKAEQIKRAQMLQARSGWGQWPHCSSKLGLR